MTAPCLTAPCSLSFLPRPRLPPRLLVQEQNHRPDLPLGEEVLPHRHRRVPGRALAGEAGPALRDAPEQDRKSVVYGKGVDLGGRRIINKTGKLGEGSEEGNPVVTSAQTSRAALCPPRAGP